MEEEINEEENINRAKRIIQKQSIWLSLAALLTFSSFVGVVDLQSSINIAGELGTTSLAICYITNIIFNAAVLPVIVKRLRPKAALIAADVLYVLYTLANIYPSYPTIITAAVLLGVAQALTWSYIPIFNSHFGVEYAKLVKLANEVKTQKSEVKAAKGTGAYMRRFTGRFYSILAGYWVVGNLLSYFILFLDDKTHNNDVTTTPRNETNMSTLIYATNGSREKWNTAWDDFSNCGSNQCSSVGLSVNVTDSLSSDDKYVIKNWILQIVLFGFFALLQAFALCVHVFLINDPSSKKKSKNKVVLSTASNNNEIGKLVEKTDEDQDKNDSSTLLGNLTATARHIMDPLKLLIVPLNIYVGMVSAFIFVDLTRSFVSCIMGVAQVGMMMAIVGVAEIISGFTFERFGANLGRSFFMAIAFTIDLANLLVCLLWAPANNWVPFVLVASFGVSEATVIEYFNHKGLLAYSSKCLIFSLGSSLVYLSSRYLCVSEKIYILIGWLVVCAVGYCFAERRFRSRCRMTKIKSSDVTNDDD